MEHLPMNAQKLLLVERVMRFMPWTVQPSDSVAHARALLDEQRINHLPVLSKGKLVGVVTVRDLLASKRRRKAHAVKCALETHPDRVRVASVMTTSVHTATPKDTLAAAATLMRREHVEALPVMEGGQLRGIINRRDIIATLWASRSAAQRNPLIRRILRSCRLPRHATIAKYL
jgi:acetoin utilization protein AcuB